MSNVIQICAWVCIINVCDEYCGLSVPMLSGKYMGCLLLTEINFTSIEFRSWIRIYTHLKPYDITSHRYSNFKDGLAKQPSNIKHGWGSVSHKILCYVITYSSPNGIAILSAKGLMEWFMWLIYLDMVVMFWWHGNHRKKAVVQGNYSSRIWVKSNINRL